MPSGPRVFVTDRAGARDAGAKRARGRVDTAQAVGPLGGVAMLVAVSIRTSRLRRWVTRRVAGQPGRTTTCARWHASSAGAPLPLVGALKRRVRAGGLSLTVPRLAEPVHPQGGARRSAGGVGGLDAVSLAAAHRLAGVS